MNAPAHDALLRLPQIIGQPEITVEQADANRARGKGPRTPRPAILPIIPISRAAWWAGVSAGKYPAPVRLGGRVTAWRRSEVLALIQKAG